jgi:galactokinase
MHVLGLFRKKAIPFLPLSDMLPHSLHDFRRSRPLAQIWRIPGRINLIGEHTDYNDGWVLPAASDCAMWVVAEQSVFNEWRLFAARYGEAISLPIEDPLIRMDHWSRYAAAVLHTVAAHGLPVKGLDIAFDGDIPVGGGMSSSSALTCGLLCALNDSMGWGLSPLQLARLAQESEHRTGVLGGIMDQYAIMHASAGHALLLDCRSLAHRQVGISPAIGDWYMLDTGVSHQLVLSAYNDRRAACQRVVAAACRAGREATHLRDLDCNILDSLACVLASEDLRKAQYVLQENQRVHHMVQALEEHDGLTAGRLLYESHAGLRDQYQVSCAELDLIVDELSASPDVLGARMMGAGFGGAVLVLGKEGMHTDVFLALEETYAATFGHPMRWARVDFCQGACEVA